MMLLGRLGLRLQLRLGVRTKQYKPDKFQRTWRLSRSNPINRIISDGCTIRQAFRDEARYQKWSNKYPYTYLGK